MTTNITIEQAKTQVGKGWWPLLDAIYDSFQKSSERLKGTEFSKVIVIQVKEKFGALRVYYDGGNDNLFDEVEGIASVSKWLCEECGQPGKARTQRGWIKTLCDACDANWDQIRTERWGV